MSIFVLDWVWKNSGHKGSELLLLLAVADFANEDGGGAYPSIPSLAKKSRLSRRQVQRVLHHLEESGELAIEYGAGEKRQNYYRITFKRSSPVACGGAEDDDLSAPEPPIYPDGDKMSPSGETAENRAGMSPPAVAGEGDSTSRFSAPPEDGDIMSPSPDLASSPPDPARANLPPLPVPEHPDHMTPGDISPPLPAPGRPDELTPGDTSPPLPAALHPDQLSPGDKLTPSGLGGDTGVTTPVTSRAAEGDTGDALRVTPVSPKPSGNRQITVNEPGDGLPAREPSQRFSWPEGMEILAALPGYRDGDHSRLLQNVTAACREAGVSPAAVARSFANYYRFGGQASNHWSDPLRALGRTLPIEIEKALKAGPAAAAGSVGTRHNPDADPTAKYRQLRDELSGQPGREG